MNVVFLTILSSVGSVACALLFNIRIKRLPYIAIVGGISYISNYYIAQETNSPLIAMFLSALIVGLLSETLAIVLKSPSLIYSLVGIIPLLPGFSVYTAMQFLFEKKISDAAIKGIFAFTGMSSIVCGVLLASSLARIVRHMIRDWNKKNNKPCL